MMCCFDEFEQFSIVFFRDFDQNSISRYLSVCILTSMNEFLPVCHRETFVKDETISSKEKVVVVVFLLLLWLLLLALACVSLDLFLSTAKVKSV